MAVVRLRGPAMAPLRRMRAAAELDCAVERKQNWKPLHLSSASHACAAACGSTSDNASLLFIQLIDTAQRMSRA